VKGVRVEATQVALWVGALVLALPVVATRYPPMTDLPMHEALLALLRHHGEPGWSPPGLYETNLGHANQLFYFLAYPLTYVASTAMACKLVVAGTLALAIIAIARLARRLEADRLIALALAPVVVGWLFYHGFVANLLGLALLVAALPYLDHAVMAPTGRRLFGAAAWLVVLQLAHQADLLAACVVLGLFAVLHPIDRRTLARLVPPLAGAALTLIEQWRTSHAGTPFARMFSQQIVFQDLSTRLRSVPSVLSGDVGPASIVLALLPLAAVAVGIASPRARTWDGEPLRARLLRLRFAAAAVLLSVCYLAMPYSVNFGFLLNARFLAPAAVLGVVAGAAAFPVAPAMRRAFAVVCASAPLATMLVALPELVEASRQQQVLEPLYAAIPRESAVAIFQFGGEPPHPFMVVASANRLLAERGGRVLFSFAEYPISPIVYRPGCAWDDVLARTYVRTTELRPAFDLQRFHYVVVHASDTHVMLAVVRAFAPDAHVIEAAGEWVLLEADAPPVSLVAPDAPLPAPPPPTLAERMREETR
jgi:hypothetical protein